MTLGGINSAFNAGGAGFVGQLGPLFGAIGAVESDRVPQGDGILTLQQDILLKEMLKDLTLVEMLAWITLLTLT